MPVTPIDSATDSRLADYRDLTDVSLRRVSEPAGGLYIAESSKVLDRALRAGHRPRSVLVQADQLIECPTALSQSQHFNSAAPSWVRSWRP